MEIITNMYPFFPNNIILAIINPSSKRSHLASAENILNFQG